MGDGAGGSLSNACPVGSGGGVGAIVVARAGACASIASSRARRRLALTWALRAKIKAAMAIASEKKSDGQ
jgi:hypothetical protein